MPPGPGPFLAESQGVEGPPLTPEMPMTVGVAPPAKGKKSKLVVVLAVVVGLLFLGGGVFAAVTLLKKAPSIAAAEYLPDGAMFVATLNLNPSLEDQKELAEIVDEFPSELTQDIDTDGGGFKQSVWSFVVRQSYYEDVEWADFEDWLGDSVTWAIYEPEEPEGEYDRLAPVLVMQHTDADAAQRFAEEHVVESEHGWWGFNFYRVVGDQLILSRDEMPKHEKIQKAPLSGNQDLKSMLSKLRGNYVVTGWINEQGISDFASRSFYQLHSVESFLVDQRMAFGIGVEQGTVVTDLVAWQKKKLEGNPESVGELVGNLPDDATVAYGVGTTDQSISDTWDVLSAPDGSWFYYLEQLGVNSKKDLGHVAGKQLALYLPPSIFGATSDFGQLVSGGLVVKTDDPRKHSRVIEDIAGQVGVVVDSETKGDKVYSTVNGDTDDLMEPRGKLADDEAYQDVIKDPNGASVIMYVNVGSITKGLAQQGGIDTETERIWRRVTAVGLVAKKNDDHHSSLSMRVSFK